MFTSGAPQSGTWSVEMLLFTVAPVGHGTHVLCGAQPAHRLCGWSDADRVELWLCKC